ncbi:MAG: hypothetical protein M3Z01_00730 [Thermoproteota archaeon]|nr:hypothetical protein [Thermoproteota archaeon]
MICLLQIINQEFQNADKNNFWGISNDAWFTGLTPILLFILGYIINKQIENRKESRRIKDLEEYLIRNLEILKEPLQKQIKSLLNLSHSLKEKKEQHFYLDDIVSFNVAQIKAIDNKDLYTIFIKDKKGSLSKKIELFGRLRANIDYIHEVKHKMKEDFVIFWEKYDKYQQEFRGNMEQTDWEFNSMISNSQSNSLAQDLFLSNLNNIRLKWATSAPDGKDYRDMFVAKTEYLQPLKILCVQNNRDPRAPFILRLVMNCIYALNDIEETKTFYRRDYLLTARKLQKSWFDISQIINEFKSM